MFSYLRKALCLMILMISSYEDFKKREVDDRIWLIFFSNRNNNYIIWILFKIYRFFLFNSLFYFNFNYNNYFNNNLLFKICRRSRFKSINNIIFIRFNKF